MAAASVQDKRRHTRVAFNNPVALHQIAPGVGKTFTILGGTILTRAKDISAGGISLQLPYPQKLSETVKINFALNNEDPLEIYGRIAWRSGLQFGLEFILRDDEVLTRIHSAISGMSN